MTKIKFTKMAGAGNDFLVMTPPKGINLKKLAVKACDRTNGVGADGLLIFEKSKTADYRMRIINADGSEAEMCGNGARCMAAYIKENQKPKKKLFSIDTLAGLVEGEATGNIANVHLSDPKDYRANISIPLNGKELHLSYIDTGVPHAVMFVDNLNKIEVASIGRAVRNHKKFAPRGTNVNFAEQLTASLVAARTYERGVEDETKACGTGSVAVALVTYLKSHPNVKNKKNAKMRVRTRGGEILEVRFDLINNTVTNVWLKGSANTIASGEYYF